jgi:shikimate kinase
MVKSQCLVLIGMAGAGKSTVGAALAKKLGYAFTDLDLCLRNNDFRSIQEIIDTQGEGALLKLEKDQMYQIDLNQRVVSPGGSIIYHTDLMDYLKERATLVYLDEEFPTIEKRITNAADRGIVGLKSHSLKEIYEERRPLYIQYADLIVKSNGKSFNGLVAEIMQAIKTQVL